MVVDPEQISGFVQWREAATLLGRYPQRTFDVVCVPTTADPTGPVLTFVER